MMIQRDDDDILLADEIIHPAEQIKRHDPTTQLYEELEVGICTLIVEMLEFYQHCPTARAQIGVMTVATAKQDEGLAVTLRTLGTHADHWTRTFTVEMPHASHQ